MLARVISMRLLRLVWSYAAETVVVILMAVMVTTLAVQVFFRYVLDAPLSWTEELARYAFVWVTFLGAAVAFRHRGHIVVDMLLHMIPAQVRAVLIWAVEVLVTITLVILVRDGLRMVETTANVRATMLQIPMSYVYASIPVSSALMLLYQLEWVVKRVTEYRQSRQAGADPHGPKVSDVGGV